MKKANREPRSWILIAILVAAAVAYAMFVFLPGQRATDQMQKQLREKRQFIAQAEGHALVLDQLSGDLQAAHQYADDWRSSAPAEGKLAATFGRITERAQRVGLAVHRFDPQPIVRLNSVWEAPISIAGEGDFPQTIEFLGLLEAMPGALWIDNLRLESGGKGDGRVRYQMTLTVFADKRDFSE